MASATMTPRRQMLRSYALKVIAETPSSRTPVKRQRLAAAHSTPRSGKNAEPVITMPRPDDVDLSSPQPVATYIRPSRIRPNGVWNVVRGLEHRVHTAHQTLQDPNIQDRKQSSAQQPEASLVPKGSRKRKTAKTADIAAEWSEALAAVKAAKAQADSIVQMLTHRKEALVAAQQDYLEPLLALGEGDEQAEELVPALLKVLAESHLEIGGGGRRKPTHLAQLLARLLAWDPANREHYHTEKKLWQQCQDTFSKAQEDLEEKLPQARRDRERQAANLAKALEKARAVSTKTKAASKGASAPAQQLSAVRAVKKEL